MVSAAETGSIDLSLLDITYDEIVSKIPKDSVDGYHEEYGNIREVCMCSAYPMFKELKSELIQDAVKKFSHLPNPYSEV